MWKFGKNSPVNVECNGSVTTLNDFAHVIYDSDVQLINRIFAKEVNLSDLTKEQKTRLKYLDSYFDLPELCLFLNPYDYLAISRCINEGINISMQYLIDDGEGVFADELMDNAVLKNDVCTFKYAISQGFNRPYTIWQNIFKTNNVTMLKIIFDAYPNLKIYDDLSYSAASYGHIEILEFLRSTGNFKDVQYIMSGAARSGHLHTLQWFVNENIGTCKDICQAAADRGHFKIMKWAFALGDKLSVRVFENAAEHGNIEILKWLKENNCPYSPSVAQMAAQGGHLDVLHWLSENNYDIKWEACLRHAAITARWTTVKWILNNHDLPDGAGVDRQTFLNDENEELEELDEEYNDDEGEYNDEEI